MVFFYMTVLALLLTVVLSLLFIKTGMFGELESTEEVIISIEVYNDIHHIEMNLQPI